MERDRFIASLSNDNPPTGLQELLQALWYDAKGNWEAAHTIAQSAEGTQSYDRLHAYLHRKEGDNWNADYWYRRAKTERFTGTLQEEWNFLLDTHL
ncbi:MAG: hypothetical protein ACRCVT_01365 [Leadbetterella sp.]